MADKKKSEVNLFPYFVDGEQPTANKFNSIGIQISRNLYIIEKALGDIWGESEPYSALNNEGKLSIGNSKLFEYSSRTDVGVSNRTYSLNIPSLARIIGPSSKLNPMLLIEGLYEGGNTYLGNSSITETIPTGSKSYCLKFKPTVGSSITVEKNSVALSEKTLDSLGYDENEYFYNSDRIEIVFGKKITSECEVTYTTTPTEYAGGPSYLGASYNVIPDESQAELGTEIEITDSQNGYYEIRLPKLTHANFPLTSDTDVSLTDADPMLEAQLKLPFVLREMFGGDLHDSAGVGAQNSLIPEGFLYLKNITTGDVYTQSEYYYMDDASLHMIPGVNEDIGDPQSDHYCIITVGTDITSSIQDLNYKNFSHSHDRSFGEAPIYFSSLVGATEEVTSTGGYYDSSLAGNYLPQYLHRDGSNIDDGLNDHNAMRGDLLIGREKYTNGNTVTTPGDYTGQGDTFKIYFGEIDSGDNASYIYSKSNTTDFAQRLQLHGYRIKSHAISNNYLYSDNDITIRSDNGITEVFGGNGQPGSSVGGYYNFSAHNEHRYGARLGSDQDEQNLTIDGKFGVSGQSSLARWKAKHMKCITLDKKNVFFSARTRDGSATSSGDEVYAWARIPLPHGLYIDNPGDDETNDQNFAHKIWSVNIMASPRNGEFSNFPAVGSSDGMRAPRGFGTDSDGDVVETNYPELGLTEFDKHSWSGSGAGGEANASVGPLDGGSILADIVNWFVAFISDIPLLGSFVPEGDAFDKVNGNGLWWKLGYTKSPTAYPASTIRPHLDIFIGEGWLTNSDMRSENNPQGNVYGQGCRISLKITIWYDQEDGLGQY